MCPKKIQKNIFLIIFLVFLSWLQISAVTGKTFFMPRAINQDSVLEQAVSHHFTFNNNCAQRFTLSNITFYQQSTESKDLARYFFPNNKTELVISGATATGPKDISATWLQIAGKNAANPEQELYLNEFKSTVSIRPQMKSFGNIVQLHKTLDRVSDRLWVSATFPIMQVETNLKLKEFNVQNAYTALEQVNDFVITDITSGNSSRIERSSPAFSLNALGGLNNSLWAYGKLKNGVQKKTGLADIKVQLGGTPFLKKNARVNVYGTATIPTGYKPKSDYLFEPILGNGRHWALGFGASADIYVGDINMLNKAKDQIALNIISTLEYNYLFQNTQKRSFDLLSNGQWSRYLLVFEPNKGAQVFPKPGINFFTKDLEVSPRSEVNWLAALHCAHRSCFLEAGYNLWWKDSEKVTLKSLWTEQIALVHEDFISDLPAIDPFAIESFSKATISSDINQIGQGDGAVINFIQQENLDLKSAAHPSRLTHKVYVVLGTEGTWKDNLFSVSGGASYEFASKNSALELWGIWAQFNLMV